MKNMENSDWESIAKHVTGEECTLKETDNQEILKQSDKMLRKIDTYYQAKKVDTEKAWQAVKVHINTTPEVTIEPQKQHKKAMVKLYKYAAIIIVSLLLSSLAYYSGFQNNNGKPYMEVISAKNEVLKEFALPDGSLVTLNRNSKLLFPKEFKENTREVTIIGEAFFDVKRNPQKPFIINAGATQVKVLGTSFNVSAYPNLKTVEVIVKTGKVEVSDTKTSSSNEFQKETIFLSPGEKGTFLTEKHVLEKSINENPNFIAWKTHNLVFNKVPLHKVIKCLEKTYNTKIDVADPILNNLVYEGRFDEKPIDFILDVIRLSFNLELSVDNEHYKLTRPNTKH